jgi:hypothetical protein
MEKHHMKVPNPVLIGLLFTAALFAGYEVNEALHSESTTATVAAAPAAVQSPIAPEPQEPVVINLTLAAPGISPAPATVVNLTLDDQTPPAATASGSGRSVADTSGPVQAPRGSAASAPLAAGTRSSGGTTVSRASQSPVATGGVVNVSPARPTVQNMVTVEAPDNRTNMAVSTGDRGNTAQDFSITAIGNNIVIAYGNSVAYAGNNGALTANTGNVASSGTIALDVADSTVATGTSVSAPTPSGEVALQSPLRPGSSFGHDGLDPSQSVSGRGVAISGYEDHSLDVTGLDHVVTYDDSNVFIARNGQINANTGDTDSAGLNVIDATGSVVNSGSQNEDGGEDAEDSDSDSDAPESPIGESDATAGVEASAETDTEESGSLAAAPTGTPVTVVTPVANASVSGDEDDDAGTTAGGNEAVVIGGDGYDDLSVDVTGVGHVVSYDDSNVVIGGEGRVNAQIGDSDTSGAVVMGVTNSIIQAGDSS